MEVQALEMLSSQFEELRLLLLRGSGTCRQKHGKKDDERTDSTKEFRRLQNSDTSVFSVAEVPGSRQWYFPFISSGLFVYPLGYSYYKAIEGRERRSVR